MNARDKAIRDEAHRSNAAILRATEAIAEETARHEAALLSETDRLSASVEDRRSRIEGEVTHEVVLLRLRCQGRGDKDKPYLYVLGKTHTKTYHDNHGPEDNAYRTKTRCESLLMLSGGEEDLLIDELSRALDKELPLPKSYVWLVQIIKSEDGRKDFLYTRRRRPRSRVA